MRNVVGMVVDVLSVEPIAPVRARAVIVDKRVVQMQNPNARRLKVCETMRDTRKNEISFVDGPENCRRRPGKLGASVHHGNEYALQNIFLFLLSMIEKANNSSRTQSFDLACRPD